MYENLGLFIDGKWLNATRDRLTVIDPATGEVLGESASASTAHVEDAIAAAAKGLKTWRATPAWARADMLHKIADIMIGRTEEAARRIVLETGKLLAQARREWQLSIDQFRWHAEEARRIYGRVVESRAPGGKIEVSHEPVGVVAAFTAWNFPCVLIARKAAPALAAGCSVIIRPSREAPGSAMLIVDCMQQAGLPAGVVNLVIGAADATYAPIMASPTVRKVSLTGSTPVGQQMIRDSAATLKRCTMELGGNAPVIVFDDVDMEAVLDLCVPVKYANAGQVCVTGDRFYVHEKLHDGFVEGFAKRASAMKLGHGLEDTTQMGPVINQRRLDAMEAIVADAVKRGGTIHAGGKRPAGQNKGFFFEPTVVSNIPDDAKALAEENFGPIAAITPFKSADEVFARANASEMGLASYVFTRDQKRQREAVARIEAGMVGINSFALAAAEAPFGGIKASGIGREGGTESIHDYMNVKLAQIAV